MLRFIIFITIICFTEIFNAQNDIDFYLNKAQKAIDEEQYVDAIKHLSKAIEYKSTLNNSYKVADLYLNRGICRYKLKNYVEGEADMNMALKISPEYLKAFESKNKIYFDSKQFDKIISNSNEALKLNSKNTKFLYWISQAYLEKHEYNNAQQFTDSILSINPDDISALRLKGLIFHKLRKYDDAVKVESLILSYKPNDPYALLNRSIDYAELKDYEKAENDNMLASKIDTSLLHVSYNNIGYFIKINIKDYEGAINFFNKALLKKPDFAYAYSNRGFCKLQLGDISGADKDIKKSIELDPSNSYAFKNLALVKLKQNKVAEACLYLKKANEKGYMIEYGEEVNELIKSNCK